MWLIKIKIKYFIRHFLNATSAFYEFKKIMSVFSKLKYKNNFNLIQKISKTQIKDYFSVLKIEKKI